MYKVSRGCPITPLIDNLEIEDIFKDEAKKEGDGVTDLITTVV